MAPLFYRPRQSPIRRPQRTLTSGGGGAIVVYSGFPCVGLGRACALTTLEGRLLSLLAAHIAA